MSLRRTSEASGRPRTMMRPNSAGSLSRPPVTTGMVSWVPGTVGVVLLRPRGGPARPGRPGLGEAGGAGAQDQREPEWASRRRAAHAGKAQTVGGRGFWMLLSLDPDRMAQLGLTVSDVAA